MRERDFYVDALVALCAREGGPEFVAEKSRLSAANLQQILKGVKLDSGRPRGVGPEVRRKLTVAYPDWLQGPVEPVREAKSSYTTLAIELADYFDEVVPRSGRAIRALCFSAATDAIAGILRGAAQNSVPPESPTPEKQP